MLLSLLYIVWDVDPNLLESPITIRWYGLLFALGFLIGAQFVKRMYDNEGVPEDFFDKGFLYAMVGTVAGARLGHVFFYDWAYYSQHLVEIPMVWKGGLASHGAGIGNIIAFWLYAKWVTKKPVFWGIDRMVVAVSFAVVFIRLGNLMNHEIVGEPTNLPWGFVFTRVDNIPRHPTQIYEAVSYFLVFLVLLWAYWKKDAGKKLMMLSGIFAILLFSFRFIWEFFKENQVAFEEGMALNMGQWLSIPFIVLGIVLVTLAQIKKIDPTKSKKAAAKTETRG